MSHCIKRAPVRVDTLLCFNNSDTITYTHLFRQVIFFKFVKLFFYDIIFYDFIICNLRYHLVHSSYIYFKLQAP